MATRLAWILALVAAPGCSTNGESAASGFADRQIVVDFADQVVVPTYGLLAQRAARLADATTALRSEPGSASFEAAREAWVSCRVPWEQSEAFLFGPVHTYGYDPALDSWPVNRTDLDAVLASDEAITPDLLANLQETLKGFHAAEYLLFGAGKAKVATDLTARELDYLAAITAEMAETARALETKWTEGTASAPPYRAVLSGAGSDDNTAYPSLAAAAQEMLDGAIGICDEVANGKVADPYDAHDPALVESQFSFNSLADFQNNVRSVENVYLGAVPEAGTRGRGLSDYVRGLDAALDARVQDEIAGAIAAIGAIPPPFRDAITTESSYAAIEAAQVAVRRLQATLEGEVAPLVLR